MSEESSTMVGHRFFFFVSHLIVLHFYCIIIPCLVNDQHICLLQLLIISLVLCHHLSEHLITFNLVQSLEAYYQEAGRAGRDGKLADCSKFIYIFRIYDVTFSLDVFSWAKLKSLTSFSLVVASVVTDFSCF